MIAVFFLSLLLSPRTDYELLLEILRTTEPLDAPRGERLPLYIWPAQSLGTTNAVEIEALLRELDARGMAAIGNWKPNDPAALEEALALARLQKRLGLPIAVNATEATYGFFDGSEKTAHIDAGGRPFFDRSFPTERKMGCPFGIDHRMPEMTARIRSAVEAYRGENLDIDFRLFRRICGLNRGFSCPRHTCPDTVLCPRRTATTEAAPQGLRPLGPQTNRAPRPTSRKMSVQTKHQTRRERDAAQDYPESDPEIPRIRLCHLPAAR